MVESVRLGELAEITGRPRETIRNMTKAAQLPWGHDLTADGRHRRFNAEHALALVVQDLFLMQGLSLAGAAEAVRAVYHTVEDFMDAEEAARPARHAVIATVTHAEEDSTTGLRWYVHHVAGSADDIADVLRRRMLGAGRVEETRGGRATERNLGLVRVASVNLREAFRVLGQRAEAAGFRIDGRRIVKIDDRAEDAPA